MSLLFLDIETSGLGSNAAVIEIAAIPYIDGEFLPSFQSYIRPHKGATLSPEAFKVNGIDPSKVWDFPEAKEVIERFVEWLDSHEQCFTIAAHNVNFDKPKLRELFCRTGNYGPFVTRFRLNHVCTMEMAKGVFHGKKKRPEGFSLTKLCKFFNINISRAHSALPDILATVDLYKELVKLKQREIPIKRQMTYQEKRQRYMALDYLTINSDGSIYMHCKGTQDPEAMRFMLSEIYDITVGDE